MRGVLPQPRRWASLLAVGAAFSASVSGGAEPSAGLPAACALDPSAEDLAAAKGLHAAASVHLRDRAYRRAERDWLAAYRFDCTAHAILLNVAIARDRAGDGEGAIAALEAYLKREGDDEAVAGRVATLRRQGASPAARPPTPTPPWRVPAPPAPPPPPDESRFIVTVAGLSAAGAMLVTGATLIAVGADTRERAKDDCARTPDACVDGSDQGDRGDLMQQVGGAFLGVGLLGGAGVLLWSLVEPEAHSPTEAGWSIIPGPGRLGIGFELRF